MKRKVLFFVMMLVASMFVVPNVFAAEPAKDDTHGTKLFFANGTPITISKRDGDADGVKVTWDGGSEELTSDYTIFGGSHETDENMSADVASATITMNGGKIRNIVGGGLHKSKVGTVTITITGGEVTGQVIGGGSSSFGATNCHKPWYSGAKGTATTIVDEAKITIGGTATVGDTVYGGGEGISYTKKATITVENGTIDSVIASGSNGYTDEVKVNIQDGTITKYMSVNRGTIGKVETTVTGGTITDLYAGSDGVGTDGTMESADISVSGNAKVANAHVGKSGAGSAKEVTSLTYEKDTITTIDKGEFNEDTLEEDVIVTLHANGEVEEVPVEVGTKLTKEFLDYFEALLNEEIKTLNYKFAGLYKDDDYTTPFEENYEFTEDIDVYVRLVKIAAREEEKNPNTSDINVLALLGIILVSGTGVAYTIRKRRFN